MTGTRKARGLKAGATTARLPTGSGQVPPCPSRERGSRTGSKGPPKGRDVPQNRLRRGIRGAPTKIVGVNARRESPALQRKRARYIVPLQGKERAGLPGKGIRGA